MSEVQFTAHYERKFADGNYGSEGLSLGVTTTCSEQDLAEGYERGYADDLRKMVLGFLATSNAERVAWAAQRELNPPAPVTVPSGADDTPTSLEDLPF